MHSTCPVGLAGVALLCAMASAPLAAQDSLRVLRFSPDAPSSPADPVIITFDHPVAPQLGQTISPARAVRISPDVATRRYWQDPSTLVVQFTNLWPAGTTYHVTLDAGLRSADGLPLARGDAASRTVTVRPPRILDATAVTTRGYVDTLVRLFVLIDAPVPTDWLAGRAWLAPEPRCTPGARGDSIPLHAERVRQVTPQDHFASQYPGVYERDRRTDSLRRVLELAAPRPIGRGCAVMLNARVGGGTPTFMRQFSIRAPFGVRRPLCGENECKAGPLVLHFTDPVAASEIRAHVRVNGQAPTLRRDSAYRSWEVIASLEPRRTYRVAVERDLQSVDGERLGSDFAENIDVPARAPGVAFTSGSFVVPRDDSTLIRIRHVNTDSVIVVVARVRDSIRARAVAYTASDWWYRRTLSLRWRAIAADSVVLRYATHSSADSAGILDVRVADVPRAWWNGMPIAVRASGVVAREAVSGDSARVRSGRLPVIRTTDDEPAFAILRRSGIATHVHSTEGDVRVWATSLRDAKMLAGARVRLVDGVGRELASGITNAHGMTRLAYTPLPDTSWRARNLMVETRYRDDVSLRSLTQRASYYDASSTDDDDDAGGGSDHPDDVAFLHGAAFAERGIYRPGEQVFLKGVARRFTAEAGYAVPRTDSARWVVRWNSAQGPDERVWAHDARLSSFGSAVDTFTVPRTARIGMYRATLLTRDGGHWRATTSAEFAVAEYRVPEFRVDASVDTLHALFGGDSARVQIDARYLFGIPMQNAKLAWWAETREVSPWEVHIRGLDGWSVGRPWWLIPGANPMSSSAYDRESRLGEGGRATALVPIGKLSRPGRVTMHATVTDANRQTVTSELSFPVHAADVYIGARLERARWVWPAGQVIGVQALVVGADGSRRMGVPVRVLALRHRWENGRSASDTVWRAEHIANADTLRLSFTPTVPGSYELLVMAQDARGREAATGLFLWVENAGSRWAQGNPRELPLSPDKQRYEPGDRAIVRVTSPEAGPALVTLSREGILSQEVVQLERGANLVAVAIPANAIPDAELSILALRAIAADDTTGIHFRRGVTHLEVRRDMKELHVAVTPDRERYQPRDTVRLSLRVRDAANRGVRSELAVWALDQGVASLTALAKPDLLASLLSWAANPYEFGTTLSAMIPRLTPWNAANGTIRIRGMTSGVALESVVTTGAATARIPVRMDVPAPAGGGGDALIRRLFATTPFYRGALVTDAQGNATVDFVLPDNLTTFRLFAVAVDEGARAGSADTSIISTRTLAVRAALPRVIREGDVLLAGAVVTQDRDVRAPVTLRAEGTGVRVAGASTLTDTLNGRAGRELRFSLQGLAGDTVTLRFFGQAGMDADAVEARLPVSPPGHPRARIVMGTLTGSARVAFPIDEALDTARSRLELQLGSSPMPLLQRLSESLRLYPYYCTEQLSSGGRALIARLRAERMLESTSRLAARDRAQLEMAVATIVSRQRDDGGFGYWSPTNWTTPWLTSYALELLEGAQELGIDVPRGALERARDYLKHAAQRGGTTQNGQPLMTLQDSALHAREGLVAAVALRTKGHPDEALEDRVIALRRHLDWVDRLTLARLFAGRGNDAEARTIVNEAWRATRVEGRRMVLDDSVAPRYWLFRSIVRPVATLLNTAAAVTPNDPRLGPLFESLIQVGRSERAWSWNTIDQTLVAEAVVTMLRREQRRATTPVTVSSGVHQLGTIVAGNAHSDTLRLPLSGLVRSAERHDTVRFALEAASNLPIYYAATLFEVPSARPVRADDEGISIERWYERYDDPTPVVSVREGELVRVRIRVTVRADREFVAIEDPLPAGLEAVDLSLRTSSALPPFEGAPRLNAEQGAEGPPGQRYLYGSWDAGWWTPWEHREIRDDRVLYFARQLWKGSYLVSYVARATTSGTFVRPPAHVEEMYNPALHGRSDGGVFTVTPLR
jgi:uncharacterized protein YfaS (alpha-2-macroglobulin family)